MIDDTDSEEGDPEGHVHKYKRLWAKCGSLRQRIDIENQETMKKEVASILYESNKGEDSIYLL